MADVRNMLFYTLKMEAERYSETLTTTTRHVYEDKDHRPQYVVRSDDADIISGCTASIGRMVNRKTSGRKRSTPNRNPRGLKVDHEILIWDSLCAGQASNRQTYDRGLRSSEILRGTGW